MAEHLTRRLRDLAAGPFAYPAAAAGIAAAALLELLTVPGMTHAPSAPLVLLLLCVPVAAARARPVEAALAEAVVLLLSPSYDGGFPALSLLAIAVIAYVCGVYASRRAGALGAAALLIGGALASGGEPVPVILAITAPWWTGRQVRRRRTLVAALAERQRELEEEEDAFARLAVRRERARIARELHDIVAHNLAVIAVQAAAGRMAAPDPGDGTRERFRIIRESGDQALAEMARLVDILHTDARGAAPTGGLQVLVDRAQAGGLDIRLTPLAPGVELPPAVESVAYRVVQEGLTNAMKHAPGAALEIRFGLHDGSVEVTVANEAPAVQPTLAATGSGLGLPGMRERVEVLGGTLDAGPRPGGGWRLAAHLPAGDRQLSLAR